MSKFHDGYTAVEYRALEAARSAVMPLRTACESCGWFFEGTTSEALEKAREHRAEKHPEIVYRRPRPVRNLKQFRTPSLTSQDEAEIETERQRRAKLTGVDLRKEASQV